MILYLQHGFLILSISSILPLFFSATATASLEEEKKFFCTGTMRDTNNKDQGEWDRFFSYNTSDPKEAMIKAKKEYQDITNIRSDRTIINVDSCKISD